MQQHIAISQQRVEKTVVQTVGYDLVEVGQTYTLRKLLLILVYNFKERFSMIFVSKRLVFLLAALLLVVACKDPSRSGYVELTGRVFIFNPRMATATYVVSLGILKPLPEGTQVEAVFDNPAGGDRIVVSQLTRVVAGKVAVESPSLLCIKKDKRYAFEITLQDASGAVLQTISSSIASSLDQSILPDAPLVVGPGYEPNPELKGNPAGKLPGGPKTQCPS
jgi:hypothetical protein